MRRTPGHRAAAASAERQHSQTVRPAKRWILSQGDEKLLETCQQGSDIPAGSVHLMQWGKRLKNSKSKIPVRELLL